MSDASDPTKSKPTKEAQENQPSKILSLIKNILCVGHCVTVIESLAVKNFSTFFDLSRCC